MSNARRTDAFTVDADALIRDAAAAMKARYPRTDFDESVQAGWAALLEARRRNPTLDARRDRGRCWKIVFGKMANAQLYQSERHRVALAGGADVTHVPMPAVVATNPAAAVDEINAEPRRWGSLIAGLPKGERELLTLAFRCDMSPTAIAGEIGASPRQVQAQFYSLIGRLRRCTRPMPGGPRMPQWFMDLASRAQLNLAGGR